MPEFDDPDRPPALIGIARVRRTSERVDPRASGSGLSSFIDVQDEGR